MFVVARFVTGLPQGAYFGAGAVVASHVAGPGHAGRAFNLREEKRDQMKRRTSLRIVR